MTSVCLVSCVSKKREGLHKAKDLYASPWFRLARRYAETFDHWAILSAKHGLVMPEAWLTAYEMTLNDMSAAERELWAENVMNQWRMYSSVYFNALPTVADSRVTMLGGKKYREALPIEANVPMKGLGIGEQLRWLKNQLSC